MLSQCPSCRSWWGAPTVVNILSRSLVATFPLAAPRALGCWAWGFFGGSWTLQSLSGTPDVPWVEGISRHANKTQSCDCTFPIYSLNIYSLLFAGCRCKARTTDLCAVTSCVQQYFGAACVHPGVLSLRCGAPCTSVFSRHVRNMQ